MTVSDQTPVELNIKRTRGDTFPFSVTLTQGGAPIDITGYTIIVTVDPEPEPANADNNLFSNTATLSDPTNGVATFTLTTLQADQTPGEYFHDMQLTDGSGNIRTFAKGTWTVEQDISK